MGRSQESFNKKNVRNRKEIKRKEKEKKRLEKKENEKKNSLDDMIAYVDEHGRILDTPPDPDEKEEIKAEDIEIGVPSREADEEDIIKKGIVSFFNDSKGYGFINELETKQSIFVHINNTLEEIREGNLVTFEIGSGPKGPTALQVKKYIPEEQNKKPDNTE
jgi:cold shock CspA family protein